MMGNPPGGRNAELGVGDRLAVSPEPFEVVLARSLDRVRVGGMLCPRITRHDFLASLPRLEEVEHVPTIRFRIVVSDDTSER